MPLSQPFQLLLVCTGNICRSPMAHGIAAHLAHQHGWPLTIQSASTQGLVNYPADPLAVAACQEIGIDLSAHRSQPVTVDLMDWADQVLVMEHAHTRQLAGRYPDHTQKVQLLGPYGGEDEIADPYGSWLSTFRTNRDTINRCIRAWSSQRFSPTHSA